jgi:hypothetical protein
MGKHITDIQQLYTSVGGLFKSIADYPEIREALLASKIVIEYELLAPPGRMLIDSSGDEVVVYSDNWLAELTSSIKLTMECDTCHLYWLGKVNFMFASFQGDIKTEGDIGMLLMLLPLAEPLFTVYTEFLNSHGMSELITE